MWLVEIFALVLLHIHHLKMWEKAAHTVAVGGFENVGILVVLGRVQRPDSTSVGCFEALERRHVYLMAYTNTPLTTYLHTISLHFYFQWVYGTFDCSHRKNLPPLNYLCLNFTLNFNVKLVRNLV